MNIELSRKISTMKKLFNDLHKNYYEDAPVGKLINEIMMRIEENLIITDIVYDEVNTVYILRIKKTDMKRYPGFSHNSIFYMPIICRSFIHAFYNNQEVVSNYMGEYNETMYSENMLSLIIDIIPTHGGELLIRI